MENKEKITFGAGCFWHVQQRFDNVKGVLKTTVGYMGGDEEKYPSPDYEQVSFDDTGYVEVVQVMFDSKKVSVEKLLDVFWDIHDPTSKNRQGNDVGPQYKSVIFYENEEQKKIAEKSKEEYQKELDKKIVTEIVKAGTFFEAEKYHQKYFEKRKACLIK